MRWLTLKGLVLAGLILACPKASARDDEDKKSPEPGAAIKPALVVRIKGLEGLIGDLRYLAEKSGQEEIAKQVEGALKARTGKDGLEGVDTKKPIGVYATVDSKLDQSQVMVMVPIADEKTFLSFLEGLDQKPEKQQDGSYKLNVENVPAPIVFRFENKYLYAMAQFNKEAGLPAKGKLPRPEDLLKGEGLLSMAVNVEHLPKQVRKGAISALALQLGVMKDEPPPNSTEKQKALWEAAFDEVATQAKSLLEDGKSLTVKLDVDRKKNDFSLSMSLTGKSGTDLAKNIASLSKATGLGPSFVGPGAAMGAWINVALPESLRKPLAPVIDELLKKAVDEAPEKDRKAAEKALKALEKTLKAGALDGAVELRGPSKAGKYTGLFAMRVKDGAEVEKTFKSLLADAPEADRKKVKLDVDKVGDVSIHSAESKMDEKGKELLGDGPAYFAVRDDALMVSVGEGALDELKKAVAAKPKAGRVIHAEASLNKIAKLMAKDQPNAVASAKRAFTEKGSDKISFSVSADKGLEVRFSMKTAVLTFFGKMDQEGEEKKDQ